MANPALSAIRALDIGPEPRNMNAASEALSEDIASGAVVAGSIVAFTPGVTAQRRQDVMESLLLAQLAANAKAERHSDPSGWFRAFSGVLEQAGWVVETSSSSSRFLPETSVWTAGDVVRDALRRRLTPDELALAVSAVNSVRSEMGGFPQFVFECPSHSGGIGNFQVAFATDDDGALSLRIAQISFNAPQHVTRVLLESFRSPARFQTAFLALQQNEGIYAKVRASISAKVAARFPGAVAELELPQ